MDDEQLLNLLSDGDLDHEQKQIVISLLKMNNERRNYIISRLNKS